MKVLEQSLCAEEVVRMRPGKKDRIRGGQEYFKMGHPHMKQVFLGLFQIYSLFHLNPPTQSQQTLLQASKGSEKPSKSQEAGCDTHPTPIKDSQNAAPGV